MSEFSRLDDQLARHFFQGALARAAALALCAALAGLAGCGGGETTGSVVAEQAADGAEASSSQSSLAALTLSGSAGASGEAIASASATATLAALTPSSCATQTTAGAQVAYSFDDCTGPYGLLHLNGQIVVTYSLQAGGAIAASYTSSGLTVNRTALTLAGTATRASSGGGTSLTFTSSSTATGPRGHVVNLSGSSAVTWDSSSQCMTLTGSWSTVVDALTWTTSATNYQRCKGSCPASGTLSYTGPLSSVTLTFDGSASADFTLGDGKSGTIELTCGS